MAGSRAGRFELQLLKRWRIPVMLLNEGMFAEAISHGFPREQLTWMPNPVDVDAFRPPSGDETARVRQEKNLPLDSGIVIYTGRLSHEKGLRSLLKGFALAAKQDNRATLVLIGDGPLRAELESLAAELGLTDSRIRFVGRVDVSQVPVWLRAADVFALTSPNEGFSCSLLEAMAAGLPSVVSDIPANLQLVDPEVHGVAVTHNDETAIGRGLLRLLKRSDETRRMAEAARSRVCANYSTPRIVERYEAIFSQAMGRRSG
jgi:glycosyltransferase involved in cell wall biosynthesis